MPGQGPSQRGDTMIFSTCGVPAEKDEHTLLLLHCDDYSDSSMYGIELMDKSAQVSTEQSKFGGKSMYFNGSTRLSIDDVSARIFDFGTGDFTVEAWIYPEEISTDNFIFSGSADGSFFFGRQTGNFNLGIGRTRSSLGQRCASSDAGKHMVPCGGCAKQRTGLSLRERKPNRAACKHKRLFYGGIYSLHREPGHKLLLQGLYGRNPGIQCG